MPALLTAQERQQIEIKYAPYMSIEPTKPDATILTRANSNHFKNGNQIQK